MTARVAEIIEKFRAEAMADPYPLFRALRTHAPVMDGDVLKHFGRGSQASLDPNRRVFTLFRHQDVSDVLRSPDRFSSRLLGDGISDLFGGFMITAADGDVHRRARNLLQPAFSPKQLGEWRLQVIEPMIVEEFVRPLQGRGRCDLVEAIGKPFPIRVMYHIMGFSPDHLPYERFADWAHRILLVVAGVPGTPQEAAAAFASAARAMEELNAFTLAFVAHRRASGQRGNDLISRLLDIRFEGEALDDAGVTDFIRTLLPASGETTTQTFNNLMSLLLDRPEDLERLRRDPRLVSRAIDEAMRLEPVASFVAREAVDDTVLHGVAIPRGAGLLLSTGSANRDEAVYENPDVFDIDRPGRANLSFGHGPHICVGMHVAKAIVGAAVTAILDGWPDIRRDPDSPAVGIHGVHRRSTQSLPVIWNRPA
jgi:Cytochrome P450